MNKIVQKPAEDRMVRGIINGVIRMLLREIRRGKLDRSYFKMKLLFDDYQNIEIAGKAVYLESTILQFLKVKGKFLMRFHILNVGSDFE